MDEAHQRSSGMASREESVWTWAPGSPEVLEQPATRPEVLSGLPSCSQELPQTMASTMVSKWCDRQNALETCLSCMSSCGRWPHGASRNGKNGDGYWPHGLSGAHRRQVSKHFSFQAFGNMGVGQHRYPKWNPGKWKQGLKPAVRFLV